MGKIIRPIKFDDARLERRRAKRRDSRSRRVVAKQALSRAILRMLWFGIEPEAMWSAGDAENDNRPKRNAHAPAAHPAEDA